MVAEQPNKLTDQSLVTPKYVGQNVTYIALFFLKVFTAASVPTLELYKARYNGLQVDIQSQPRSNLETTIAPTSQISCDPVIPQIQLREEQS
jgi:hypothetical protein